MCGRYPCTTKHKSRCLVACPDGMVCAMRGTWQTNEQAAIKSWNDAVKSARYEKEAQHMAENKTAKPCGGPVYSLRKDGVICCQSSLSDLGYSAGMLKELRAAGYELYKDEKRVWSGRK